MPTVVLARHGETTWNRERRIQGWAPATLTETGREQAVATGEHLASTYDVDRLLSSDLDRALETARQVYRALPAAPEFERAAAWRERDFGALQGLSYDELFSRFPEYAVLDAGHTAATARPRGGERWVDARARTLRALDELVAASTRDHQRDGEGGGRVRDAEEDIANGQEEIATDSGGHDSRGAGHSSGGADDTRVCAGRDAAVADETTVVVTHGGPIRHVLAALLELDVAETIVELEPGNCSVTELRVGGPIELPAEPDGGVYEPAFPEVTSIERRSACDFLDVAVEADE